MALVQPHEKCTEERDSHRQQRAPQPRRRDKGEAGAETRGQALAHGEYQRPAQVGRVEAVDDERHQEAHGCPLGKAKHAVRTPRQAVHHEGRRPHVKTVVGESSHQFYCEHDARRPERGAERAPGGLLQQRHHLYGERKHHNHRLGWAEHLEVLLGRQSKESPVQRSHRARTSQNQRHADTPRVQHAAKIAFVPPLLEPSRRVVVFCAMPEICHVPCAGED
eukprot:scaffold6957_cov96-Isochrysis_galbana.AAC.1